MGAEDEKKNPHGKEVASPPTDGVAYDQLHKITETVYLSDVFAIIDPNGQEALKQQKIKHVLTASHRPVGEDVPEGVRYKWIKVYDMHSEDLLGSGVLQEGLKYIDDADAKQESILVHCEAGVSRSVTMVCAHIMKKNGWTVEETVDYIRERRPQAEPNKSFLVQLKIFEKAGYNSDPSTIRQTSAYTEHLPELMHYGVVPRRQSSSHGCSML